MLPLVFFFSLFFGSTTVNAQDNEGFRFGLGNTNQVFNEPDKAKLGSFFALNVSGGVPAEIRVELVDVYADEFGVKKPVPLNSTPFTAKDYLKFDPVAGTYLPNGTTQTINVPFEFINIDDLERQIIGGLKISFAPMSAQSSSSSGLKLNPSVVGTFSYYPVGLVSSEKFKPAPELTFTSVSFQQMEPDFFPLRLIPNLPGVINNGPFRATVRVKNTGNIFLDTKTDFTVTKSSFFGSGAKQIFAYQGEKAMVITGQVNEVSTELTSKVVGSERAVDQIPSIGFISFNVTSVGMLGSSEVVRETKKSLVLVFPWKILVLVLLIILALYLLRKRSSKEPPPEVSNDLDLSKEALETARRRVDEMLNSLQQKN
jgi:hypothetical protein